MAAAAEVFSDFGDEIIESPELRALDGGLKEDNRIEEKIEFTAEEELALYTTIECIRAARQDGESAATPEELAYLHEQRDKYQGLLSEDARAKVVFFAHGPILTPELA